jgi:exopolyphosphatase/guanosine-5'-triphosphate,3'-diphosphate pyrophosphatase
MAPLAALILRRLVALTAPHRVVFSAFGLREGYAYGLVPPEARAPDPLIAACKAIARGHSRFAADGDRLLEWVTPLFPNLAEPARRLHRAACWLGDIAWSDHPDYRAEQAFTRALRMPFAAAGHADRVFIASVLHARYGGAGDDPIIAPTRRLLDERMAGEVRSLGLALRLAYTLGGGVVDLLSEAPLRLDGRDLVLEVPPDAALLEGEAVQRRFEALARALGATPLRRPRRARSVATA